MTDTPEEKFETQKQAIWGRKNTFENDGYVPSGQMSERDAISIENLCTAFDPNYPTTPQNQARKARFPTDKQGNRAITTLWGWMYQLTRLSRDLHSIDSYPNGLHEATSEDINRLTKEAYVRGTAPSTSGMKKSSAQTYQLTARVFYRFYHDEFGIDSDEIDVFSSENTNINPEDILTHDEIQSLSEAADHTRDLMIFHLLLYTGIRSNAARTLRIRDINLMNGTYQFNCDIDGQGLKGADKRNGPRPLLFAQSSVEKWVNNDHPSPDDPLAYLITAKQEWKQTPHNPVGNNLLRNVLEKLKRKSGVSKPLNPHMLRHNFVTICKADYNLDNDTIKFLIGHNPESKVMERTYAHLSDREYLRKITKSFGVGSSAHYQSRLTPNKCACGTTVIEGSKACYYCGTIFTPDAKHVKTNIIHEANGSKIIHSYLNANLYNQN